MPVCCVAQEVRVAAQESLNILHRDIYRFGFTEKDLSALPAGINKSPKERLIKPCRWCQNNWRNFCGKLPELLLALPSVVQLIQLRQSAVKVRSSQNQYLAGSLRRDISPPSTIG
jgi:hypothetical protein